MLLQHKNLIYKQYGDTSAPLILFLHGGGVSGWMWDRQVSHFKQQYHCVVPDLPGHGANYSNHQFTIKQTAAELIELIEMLAPNKQVIAIGFSLGAQILVQMLSDRPELIDYAMINSALVQPMPLALAMIGPSIRLSYPFIKIRAFAKLQAAALYINDEHFERYYQESLQINRELLITVLKENMSFHIPDNFHKARTNLLITVGEHEKKMMQVSARKLQHSNKNSRLVIFGKVGHGVSLQNPARFNETITCWLNSESSSFIDKL